MQASDQLARRVSVASALVLIVGLSFAAGFLFHLYKPWPHSHVYAGLEALARGIRTGAIVPKNAVIAAPANASREPFVSHVPDRRLSGYRAVMGFLGPRESGYGIRLIDASGQVVHVLRLDYRRIAPWDDAGGGDAPHDMLLFPDGSAIATFDHGEAMARFDRCGVPMWVQRGRFHHSLDRAEDGTVWTWRGDGSSVAQYQYMVRLNPDTGETLQQIGLVEDLIMKSPAIAAAFSVPPGYELKKSTGPDQVDDLFHPNDVEVLKAGMASRFPAFAAGDLLISLRTTNMVAVVDPVRLEVKWARYGPWIGQHDPDFTADGRISIYNNNTGGTLSSIVSVDPGTNDTRLLDAKAGFYTAFMGKHTILPDHSIQVVVPGEGRVLEFDRDGNLLLEINNVFSTAYNGYVADANWFKDDYFSTKPETWKCDAR